MLLVGFEPMRHRLTKKIRRTGPLAALEDEFQRELQLSGIVSSLSYDTEVRVPQGVVRHIENRRIRQVERFGPELKPCSLRNRESAK